MVGSINPSIAVVTICFNDLEGLRRTAASIELQSRQPAEWFVVDGGSSDGTVEWLGNLAYGCLKWVSEPDGGIYPAMNKGLRHVGSDYVLFLNSGDSFAHSEVIAELADALRDQTPSADLIYGDSYEVGPRGERFKKRSRGVDWIPIGMPTPHQAMLFRREAIVVGYDERYQLSGDYALVCSIFRRRVPESILRLPLAICDYALGGRSEQRYRELLDENDQIRRDIIGMGQWAVGTLRVLHELHFALKRSFFVLHRWYRYSSAE